MKEALPPPWCSQICRNSMQDVCIESCAVRRDCSRFEVKKDLKLSDMPAFPKTDGMTREERFTAVTVYLAKVVDQLQGRDNEPVIRRPYPDSQASLRVLASLQKQDLLHDQSETNPLHSDREERQSTSIPADEMAHGDD